MKDYWKNENSEENWRVWKSPKEWGQNIEEDQRHLYMKEMEMRKIPIRAGLDILRWGYKMKGNFTVKEAYDLKAKKE